VHPGEHCGRDQTARNPQNGRVVPGGDQGLASGCMIPSYGDRAGVGGAAKTSNATVQFFTPTTRRNCDSCHGSLDQMVMLVTDPKVIRR
jgi:hypothetical protein